MKIVSVREMHAIEQAAVQHGLDEEGLMRRAGLSIARIINERYTPGTNRTATGLIGGKNNGGDTLLALIALAKAGWQVRAFLVKPRSPDDPLVARLIEARSPVVGIEDDPDFKTLAEWLQTSTILLDGIAGTGVQLPLRQETAKVCRFVRQFERKPAVVAVDCPSGVDCDSGAVAPETIPANLTICIEAVKRGMLRFPAFEFLGDLAIAPLNLPVNSDTIVPADWRVTGSRECRSLLPPRPPTAHKGTFGKVLISAGCVNYPGAALLAARAAYRAGAGLVTLAVPPVVQTLIAGQIPEATWVMIPDENGGVGPDAVPIILQACEKTDALLIGPGWGMDGHTGKFLTAFFQAKNASASKSFGFVSNPVAHDKALKAFPKLVIDADGLKLLAALPGWHELLPPNTILTPHPGEMSVLTGLSIQEIQENRIEIAARYAQEWRQVVVLKGALTVVSDPAGKTRVIPLATSALATAGTGDVLAGMIAGYLAQGLQPFEAGLLAAWVHANAGILAARQHGAAAAVIAGDVVEVIPNATAELANSKK